MRPFRPLLVATVCSNVPILVVMERVGLITGNKKPNHQIAKHTKKKTKKNPRNRQASTELASKIPQS